MVVCLSICSSFIWVHLFGLLQIKLKSKGTRLLLFCTIHKKVLGGQATVWKHLYYLLYMYKKLEQIAYDALVKSEEAEKVSP